LFLLASFIKYVPPDPSRTKSGFNPTAKPRLAWEILARSSLEVISCIDGANHISLDAFTVLRRGIMVA
jgi:hypothetical protein